MMVRIELELDDSVHAALRSVVARCNAAQKSSGGANTHGELNVKKLLTLLPEDAAMMQSRSGSWEASTMQKVLDAHGYPSCNES